MKFVIARTWEEAEQILGERPSGFVVSGSFGSPGSLVEFYPNSDLVLWRDPLTGLIVGFSTKK
jgi:hypothetical protein